MHFKNDRAGIHEALSTTSPEIRTEFHEEIITHKESIVAIRMSWASYVLALRGKNLSRSRQAYRTIPYGHNDIRHANGAMPVTAARS